MSPVNGSSMILNAREVVPEEFVLQLKGKEKLLFITVAEVQLGFLTLCRVKIMLYLPNTCWSLITWCSRWKHQLRPWYCDKQDTYKTEVLLKRWRNKNP